MQKKRQSEGKGPRPFRLCRKERIHGLVAQDSSLPAHSADSTISAKGVVRPKSVAGTPSTPSKTFLRVVLTNLRSSGGAQRAPPLFARALTAAEGFELGEQLKAGLVILGAVPFHARPCLLSILRLFPR